MNSSQNTRSRCFFFFFVTVTRSREHYELDTVNVPANKKIYIVYVICNTSRPTQTCSSFIFRNYKLAKRRWCQLAIGDVPKPDYLSPIKLYVLVHSRLRDRCTDGTPRHVFCIFDNQIKTITT